MPCLIDSNVLIDVSRGHQPAIQYLDHLLEPWMLSQITAMELIAGARNQRELTVIDGFLSQISVIPLSDHIGVRAYELLKAYAKSDGLHVFDALIAATAIELSYQLVTRNFKHYRMIAGLRACLINGECHQIRVCLRLFQRNNSV